MNLRSLDLNLLVVFDAIFQDGNVTRAAKRIGMTQSAASNALTRLRGHLSDELFLRGSDGLRPTPRALELAPVIHSILTDLKNALNPPKFDPATERRRFTIAAVDYFTVVLAPALLKILSREAPGIQVKIMPPLDRAFEALDHGQLDFAIAPYGGPPERLGHKRLIEDSYSCIVRRGHPLSKGRLTMRRYAKASHLMVNPSTDARGFEDYLLEGSGLTRHVAMIIDHFAAAPPLVAASDLIVTAPTLVLKRLLTDDLVLLPSPIAAPPVFRCLDIVWHKRLARHPAHDWFRSAIERAALGLGGDD